MTSARLNSIKFHHTEFLTTDVLIFWPQNNSHLFAVFLPPLFTPFIPLFILPLFTQLIFNFSYATMPINTLIMLSLFCSTPIISVWHFLHPPHAWHLQLRARRHGLPFSFEVDVGSQKLPDHLHHTYCDPTFAFGHPNTSKCVCVQWVFCDKVRQGSWHI